MDGDLVRYVGIALKLFDQVGQVRVRFTKWDLHGGPLQKGINCTKSTFFTLCRQVESVRGYTTES